MSDEEPGRVRLTALGGEVITTESDEEEMGMIIGAVLAHREHHAAVPRSPSRQGGQA